MRIAVLADTHDRIPADLPTRLAGADEIWHLGDVCDPAMLAELELLGRPLFVVRGNCDEHPRWPLTRELEREGRRFLLVHIPPPHAPPGIDALLHGHTHVPRDEVAEGVRWLNPGCITRPRGGSAAGFAWLEVCRGQPLGWEWITL